MLSRKERKRAIGSGSAVGLEGEFADTILHTFLLEFLFSGTNPSDLRVSIDHRGYGVVVYMAHSASKGLYACDTILLGLVSQHRTMNTIA